jgi:hypothetical protein
VIATAIHDEDRNPLAWHDDHQDSADRAPGAFLLLAVDDTDHDAGHVEEIGGPGGDAVEAPAVVSLRRIFDWVH